MHPHHSVPGASLLPGRFVARQAETPPPRPDSGRSGCTTSRPACLPDGCGSGRGALVAPRRPRVRSGGRRETGVSGRKEPWTRCAGRPLSLPGLFPVGAGAGGKCRRSRSSLGRRDAGCWACASRRSRVRGEAGRGWCMGAHPGSRAEPACALAAVMPGAERASIPGLCCPGRSVRPLNTCSPPRRPQASSKPEVGSSLEEATPAPSFHVGDPWRGGPRGFRMTSYEPTLSSGTFPMSFLLPSPGRPLLCTCV